VAARSSPEPRSPKASPAPSSPTLFPAAGPTSRAPPRSSWKPSARSTPEPAAPHRAMASAYCWLTRVRRARSLRGGQHWNVRFCGCATSCRYWSSAGATAELRMLRPGPRPGIPRRAYLHIRMHLVPRLRREHPARRLPELRRRTRPASHPSGPSAHGRPAVDQEGYPTRMRPGIRPLIASRRVGAEPSPRLLRAARYSHHLTPRRQQVSSLVEWLSSSRLDVPVGLVLVSKV
jgi:hypothetical protein